jgi:thiol-disulfide isomerase/thioredoxin/DNA-binding beta-propeller fold protein YncE
MLLTLIIAAFSVACDAQAQNDEESEKVMIDDFLEGNTSAPDFPEAMDWLNTDRPLSLKEFRGKIVLLDFWTFCCINCMHVIPALKKLEEKYAEELVVIGVHSAKFTNEKGTEAIRQAILRYGIEHPVVNDRDFKIWRQYGVSAWPSFVLINPKGKIIGVHSGEGIYEPFDKIIGEAVDYFAARGELEPGPLNLDLEKSDMPNTLLSFPGKVKADSASGRLIITDSNNDRIIITDPDGKILEAIGSGNNGQADGSFEEAEFNRPQGTYKDGDIIYIADTENHLIRKADLKSRTVETILGCGEQADRYNIPGAGTDVCLNSPWDLVRIGDKLYIAMAGSHQLWVADLNTLEARPFAGSAREARIDGPLAEAALAQPSGITTGGKKLYFADSEISSIRSADIDPDGEVRTIVGEDLFEYGDIDGDYTKARLQHPLGIVYHDGILYVADTYNSKIKKIDPEKRTSYTYAGTGKSGHQDGKLNDAEFYEPGGVTYMDEKLYVADVNNHAIRVIDTKAGAVSTLQFSNLERLHREEEAEFTGRIVELPKQNLKSGDSKVIFNLRLPEGYKYIENSPFSIDYKSDNGSLEFTQKPSELNISPKNLPLTLAATAMPGMTELDFDAVVYFCSDASGVCMIDDIKVKVPVEITESGTSELSIDVDIEAKD